MVPKSGITSDWFEYSTPFPYPSPLPVCLRFQSFLFAFYPKGDLVPRLTKAQKLTSQ